MNSMYAVPLSRVSDLPAFGARYVTEKQILRLYGIARGRHWSRVQVAECVERLFCKCDPSQLTRMEYDRICNFILEAPSPTGSIISPFEVRRAS